MLLWSDSRAQYVTSHQISTASQNCCARSKRCNLPIRRYGTRRLAGSIPSAHRNVGARGANDVKSRKVNIEKVRASLNTTCPKCGKVITPTEVMQLDFERMKCPACGELFTQSPSGTSK